MFMPHGNEPIIPLKMLMGAVVVNFIGGGNQSTQRKPSACHKSLTNFII
jgi:hypothetical protein